MLETLANRMALVEKLAEYKRDNNVAAYQVDRFREVLETRAGWGRSNLSNSWMLFSCSHGVDPANQMNQVNA